MSVQYICSNRKRREAVREHPTLNGIDYLEVLDRDAAALGLEPQRTLLVHFLKAAPALSLSQVRIEGGVRISPVNVLAVFPATAVPPFQSMPEAANILVVGTDSAGDFSTYTLVLNGPGAGIDPQLSAIDFSFKVECPNDFDCKSAVVCPPQIPPEPLIDYLAKDYPSFRRLMLDRLAVIMPEWQERNAADIGIALVELLAYAGDHLSYYQDAVATEAYLGTARQRISVRRHARLLDYRMHEGCNSRAWVFIEVEPFGEADGALFAGPSSDGPGTVLLTKVRDPRGSFAARDVSTALAHGAQAFETLHDVILRSAHNEMAFYTWSDDRCCLPKGATRATLDATLDYESGGINVAVGEVLVFEEKLGVATGAPEDADPSRRWAVRLTSVTPGFDPLTGTPVVDIEWDAADALPFPFCLSAIVTDANGERAVTGISVARGNIVLADQGLTVTNKPLVPAAVPPRGLYRPRLEDSGITFRVPYDDAAARKAPARNVLAQEPRNALPAVRLDGDGGVWTPRLDLLESDRFARDFVVETQNDGTAQLRFGNDDLGRRPAASLTATYRTGNGKTGNVGAGAIAHVVTPFSGIRNVRNPLPATGGTDPETLAEVRLYAPQAFRTQQRAVTAGDWAIAAESHAEVEKAEAVLRWTGSWYTVFVTVDRSGGRAVDEPFRADLRGYLERFRLAGYDLEIEAPKFVPLDIAFTVCVAPGYFAADVQAALLETLSAIDLPDGRRGFFHPDNFTFGQPVYLSQIVAAAMQIPGVLWIDTDDTPPSPNRFRRFGQASRGETAAGRITLAQLEIARLDNDPNAPENGKIEFFMKGGL